MKRRKSETKFEKFETFASLTRQKSVHILIAVGVLYLLLVTLEIPFVFSNSGLGGSTSDAGGGRGVSSREAATLSRPSLLQSEVDLVDKDAPTRPLDWVSERSGMPAATVAGGGGSPWSSERRVRILSSLGFDPRTFDPTQKDGSVELHKAAKTAWEDGRRLWRDIESGKVKVLEMKKPEDRSEPCPPSVSLTGSKLLKRGEAVVVELPCGLTLGSHVTVVGKPRGAHEEIEPRIALAKDGGEPVMVSQFMMELQGLKTVEGEDPPRVLHFNPRLKGDWSGKPVIEQNTCYRMQWGSALRCEGWKSKADEETG